MQEWRQTFYVRRKKREHTALVELKFYGIKRETPSRVWVDPPPQAKLE